MTNPDYAYLGLTFAALETIDARHLFHHLELLDPDIGKAD